MLPVLLGRSASGWPIWNVLPRRSGAGLAGDRQRNLKYHGGARRAVCLESDGLAGSAMELEGGGQGRGDIEGFDVARARRLVDEGTQSTDLCDQRRPQGRFRGRCHGGRRPDAIVH